jgi:hypothetical protein
VKKALGVDQDAEWQECNMGVNAQFYGDFMRDFSTKLVPLLEDDIRVLIYAGAACVYTPPVCLLYCILILQMPCDCHVA